MSQKFIGQACTPNTRTIIGTLLYTKYKTHMVFGNNTPGHPLMEAVVLACRTYACPAVEVVLMIYLTNPNTHPSADYN